MRVAWLALALVLACAGTADAAKPRCHGAADRDPERRCDNPRLARSVTPTPDEAAITPNLACTRGELGDTADACGYGVEPAQAVATVMIVGDSHAAHWRGALSVVAKRKRWRVLEIARPHCPFSLATPSPREPAAAECPDWNQSIIAFLAARPEIGTLFISNNARLPMAIRGHEARAQGHVDAIRALPASVTRVVVLRDPPIDRVSTHDCVRRTKRDAGRACAVPRRKALASDATVTAARRVGADVVDLTPHFCSRRVCYPVVGGVLVHKDVDHLTQAFSASLGPYLLRAIERQQQH